MGEEPVDASGNLTCATCGRSFPPTNFRRNKRNGRGKTCRTCRTRQRFPFDRIRRAAGDTYRLRNEIGAAVCERLIAAGHTVSDRLCPGDAAMRVLNCLPVDEASAILGSMDAAAMLGYFWYEPRPMPELPLQPGSVEKIEAMRARLERGEAAMSEEITLGDARNWVALAWWHHRAAKPRRDRLVKHVG